MAQHNSYVVFAATAEVPAVNIQKCCFFQKQVICCRCKQKKKKNSCQAKQRLVGLGV